MMLFMYELMYFHETFYCVKYLFTRTNDQKGVLNKPPGDEPARNCLANCKITKSHGEIY